MSRPVDRVVYPDIIRAVQLVNGVTRRIVWPTVDFYAASVPGSAHDVILVYGVEPQLRWRTRRSSLA